MAKQKPKPAEPQRATLTDQHQWTHDSDRVLLVKCVGPDGRSHGGFVWPRSGPVRPDSCSTVPDCDSGGLFGWPWGFRLGGGKRIAAEALNLADGALVQVVWGQITEVTYPEGASG